MGRQSSSLQPFSLPTSVTCVFCLEADDKRRGRRAALTNMTSVKRFVATAVVENVRVALGSEGPAMWRGVAAALQLSDAQRADIVTLWRAFRCAALTRQFCGTDVQVHKSRSSALCHIELAGCCMHTAIPFLHFCRRAGARM